ncbi:hypothetical protein [Catellatospora citrea]|uniref:Uncharacterized protein n=1 Tax=Catellatospora citrea TaxID=53366 RepID=A0A8J3KC72_9ACTN|nr:hypothetical protein [Catellatospora citrea]RKE09364.1 hypothetical protein C8E86_4251 [Catellatospora citrea]GIF97321.1 hypothetical protein Cci01nite_24150 [Catellatospora citrea]
MEAVRLILRYAHLVGFALLLGGALVQYYTGRIYINAVMLWGATIQVVTGIALAAPLGREVQPDPAKLAVKGVIAIMIFIMVLIPYLKKRETVNKGHFLAIIGLTLINAAVAVFWR